jgi:hypothetical protein
MVGMHSMQWGRKYGVATALALLIAAICPTHALAFRAVGGGDRFDRQPVVAWQAESIALEMSTTGSPLAASTLEAAAMTSADKWATGECLAPSLTITSGDFANAEAGDGRNSLQWVTSDWKGRGFDVTAPAQTDVQFERNAEGLWRIVEADIYLNADTFSWSDAPTEGHVTLEPVLLHELGHVLGLLHPCGDDAPSVPACNDDPAFDVVMNPAYSAERTAPTDDDLAGICVLYGQQVAGCKTDADCQAAQSCSPDGACVAGSLPIGVSCGGDRDCESGQCADEVCTQPCTEAADCPADSSCSVKAGVGACTSALRDLGESCSQSEECATRQCVLDQQGKGYCTRSCTADDVCPQNWTCGAAHAEQVCIPHTIQAGGGACTIASPRPSTTTYAWLTLFASLCLLCRRPGKRQC